MKNIENLLFIMLIIIVVGCSESNDDNVFVPKTITPTLIAQGNGCECIAKQNLVIKRQWSWDYLKEMMGSVNSNTTDSFSEKEIDFSKYQVIAVFDELKSNGDWSIDITDVTEYEDSIVVSVQNLQMGNSSMVMTRPYHIVKIPVFNKKVIFHNLTQNEDIKDIELDLGLYTEVCPIQGDIFVNFLDRENLVIQYSLGETEDLKYEIITNNLIKLSTGRPPYYSSSVCYFHVINNTKFEIGYLHGTLSIFGELTINMIFEKNKFY